MMDVLGFSALQHHFLEHGNEGSEQGAGSACERLCVWVRGSVWGEGAFDAGM
jgi:hypothetical protein